MEELAAADGVAVPGPDAAAQAMEALRKFAGAAAAEHVRGENTARPPHCAWLFSKV